MTITTEQKILNVYELIALAKSKNVKGVIYKEIDSCCVHLNISPWVITFFYKDEAHCITFINQNDWDDRVYMIGEDSTGKKKFFNIDGEFAELRFA